ncbi:MAG: formyltransferase family protein [Acidobacteriota bacterium]
MHIVLFGATQRGLKFLQHLRRLCPQDELTVVSFREEPWEPPFLDDLRAYAAECGAAFIESKSANAEQCAVLWERPVDLFIMVSWRYLLPMTLLDRARLAAVVLHDSLLPAYSGFAPTVWAMINGERECGATMIHAVAEVDAGDIIDQERIGIGPDETIAAVMERITTVYLTLLERNIEKLKAGSALRRPQDRSLATFTCKRVPADNLINWHQPLRQIYNLIRAVTHPYPGAFTFHRGKKLTIWTARPDPADRRYVGAIPGRVVEIRPGVGVVVLTQDGALQIETVQIEGEAECCAADLIRSISAQLG